MITTETLIDGLCEMCSDINNCTHRYYIHDCPYDVVKKAKAEYNIKVQKSVDELKNIGEQMYNIGPADSLQAALDEVLKYVPDDIREVCK